VLHTMDPVVRLFTSHLGSVRWETSIVGEQSLEFRVCGPLAWSTSSVFSDAMTLMRHQSEYERFLLDNGYKISMVDERRKRPDRRKSVRSSFDRRRRADLDAI
jgi:hypothetical protein